MKTQPLRKEVPAPVNDNLDVSFDGGSCTVKIGPVTHRFEEVWPAKFYIDAYYSRPL